jgi:hypothetical protein
MALTIFELVKIALDRLYAEGTRIHASNLDERITNCLAYLSESYRILNDRQDAGRLQGPCHQICIRLQIRHSPWGLSGPST